MIKSIVFFLIVFFMNLYSAELAPLSALAHHCPAVSRSHQGAFDYLCHPGQPRTPTVEEFLGVVRAFNEEAQRRLSLAQIMGLHVQREFVPAGCRVCVMGDIHGSLSLFRNFEYMKNNGLLDDIDCWIFLGDYADRGNFGVEVYYGLLKLKLEKWDKVFMLRGNHETLNVAGRYGLFGTYGLSDKRYGMPGEVELKFRAAHSQVREALGHLFGFLPMALYIGSGNPAQPDWIQCCHGGIEPTFNPKEFLASRSDVNYCSIQSEVRGSRGFVEKFGLTAAAEAFAEQFYSSGDDCGLNWCDFDHSFSTPVLGYLCDRGYVCNPLIVPDILAACGLMAIIRGHQHRYYGLKIGGQDHWISYFPGSTFFHLRDIAKFPVLTLSTSSGVESIDCPYDCFCILQTGDSYGDWVITPHERPYGAVD